MSTTPETPAPEISAAGASGTGTGPHTGTEAGSSAVPGAGPAAGTLAGRLAERDVLRELAAGRALLMQLAHPGVAAGVAEHSDFADRPLARLFGTLDLLLVVTYGTPEQAARIAAKVRGIHGAVRGEGYSGNDPGLQMWVNATLIDAAPHIHENVPRRPPQPLLVRPAGHRVDRTPAARRQRRSGHRRERRSGHRRAGTGPPGASPQATEE